MRLLIACALVAAMPACSEEEDSPARPLGDTMIDGAWVYRDDGPIASFAPPNGEAAFSIACDAARGVIVFRRAGDLTANPDSVINIFADDRGMKYPAEQSRDNPPYAVAETPADDPLLNNLVAPTTLLTVTATALPTITMPGHPGVAHVITSCRT